MRQPGHGDVVAAARVLAGLPEGARARALGTIFADAAAAWAHVASTGRLHPVHGDGSLMAICLRRKPPAEPSLSDPDYCLCLAMVYARLASGRLSRPRTPGI